MGLSQDHYHWRTMLDGQAAGLEGLFRAWYPRLVRYAHRFLPDPQACQEAVQEVFVRLWERALAGQPPIPPDVEPGAWLHTSVRNACLNQVRNAWRFSGDAPESATPLAPDPSALAENQELGQRIAAAVATLPEKARLVFTLAKYEGLSYAEIAEQLQISPSTVENHMNRALRGLRESLAAWQTR